MFESRITIKGQTTLPRGVRDSLALKAGDKVRYVILDGGALIMPVRPTSRLFGSMKYDGPPVSLEEMEDSIAEGAVEG
ncbi:MAG: type II toxin-antitoxin system PrlF family antitoxin [Dehalococcoidia bacterium]|nr:type II toxin-antitoxin system PrlF family antitoxin [Dehalococcoidia bacterium]